MSIKGGFIETSSGWHGSTTRIKILARDFLADDDAVTYGGIVTDELNSTGAVQVSSSSQEMYAYVPIPTGYKATECRINCSSSIQVRVWHCDIIGTSGTEISDVASTQFTNTLLSLTETSSTDENFIMVFVYTAVTTDLVYGGYITIERI
tara:strand:+ start:597 stop:1046 length:450 start_codon:yes stop_codon:yes gene_type:complete